jgi:predicted DNA-binding transcriptional regulator AlpA|tara:strand:- start:88 stop:390 length:303 start_codon:yes stop_codon:yes gene_type:complete
MKNEKLLIHLTEKELGDVIERKFNDCFCADVQQPTKMGSDQELISSADLQRLLGISRTTIHNWVKKGILPLPIKLGKLNYFLTEDVKDLISQKRKDNEGV